MWHCIGYFHDELLCFSSPQSGKKWHDRRKAITPAFHFNILERFVEVFDRLGNTVVEKLSAVGGDKAIEFFAIANLYTLDVMCGELLFLRKTELIQMKKEDFAEML